VNARSPVGGRIVGRDAALESLDQSLGRVHAGRAEMVFVRGEPGIGKTFLLAELEARADASGCLVLTGSAAQFEQELPFGPLVDALDSYVQSLGQHIIERLAADGRRELAEVFPALRALRSPTAAPPTAAERFRTYFALRDLLERLAARQPLVLVVDDLHWADASTLEFLAHLLRRPPDGPVLVAAGLRPGADPAWVRMVEGAAASGSVRMIDLGPLSDEQAATLVGIADEARRERVLGASGGNPFYLLQLAKSASELPPPGGVALIEAPPAVAASIAAELELLSPAAQAFVAAAAVAGDPFEFDLAAETVSIDAADASAALDELSRRDLVRPAPVPRRFRFRHPLVRSAVYELMSVTSRWEAHARCAAALAARGAPVDVRVHHVEQSARPGDASAAAVLIEAADAAAHRAPATAARWYDAAVRVLPVAAPPHQRIGLLTAAATAHAAAGALEEARDRLLAGIAVASAEPPDVRVRLISACAAVEQRVGLHDDARGRLLGALAEIAPGHPARVAVLVALADDCFYRADYAAMHEWGTQAVASLPAESDDLLRAAAHAVLALGGAFSGQAEEALHHRNIAADLVDRLPDDVLTGGLDVLGHLGGTEVYLDMYAETWDHTQRAIRLARSSGQNDVFPMLYPCAGTSSMVLGRLTDSAAILDAAVEAARLTGNAQNIGWGLLNRALCALMAGDLVLGRAAGEESVSLLVAFGDETFLAQLSNMILAWVECEDGDHENAAERMISAGGGVDLPRVGGGWRTSYLEVLVRSLLGTGRLADARCAATAAGEVADHLRLPRSAGMADRAGARVALAEGDHALAVELAGTSIASLGSCGALIDVNCSRVVLGRALAALGRTDEAAEQLRLAGGELDRLGAVRYRDEAEQQLRKLGLRVHRRSTPGTAPLGLASLSGREREIALLVVGRRTNVQIASELFLSLKTVETHMRNVFRKLDVSSRVEVARAVEAAP
jgi:DNA-binding CsgD family transcriptional regulator